MGTDNDRRALGLYQTSEGPLYVYISVEPQSCKTSEAAIKAALDDLAENVTYLPCEVRERRKRFSPV